MVHFCSATGGGSESQNILCLTHGGKGKTQRRQERPLGEKTYGFYLVGRQPQVGKGICKKGYHVTHYKIRRRKKSSFLPSRTEKKKTHRQLMRRGDFFHEKERSHPLQTKYFRRIHLTYQKGGHQRTPIFQGGNFPL